ncbi:MAG: glycosyltransferase family 4 protein [Candidatus Aenigmatarchaeota archaeon]
MSDIAFIFSKKAHAASQEFAKSINADFYSVSRYSLYKIFTIPKYKYYFVESVFALTYPVMKRKILREKNKIIFRCNSNLFSNEPKRYFQGNFFVRKYIKFLLRNIDGIIAVSKMVENDAKRRCKEEIGKKIKTKLVYSFVDNPEKWLNVKPNLKSKNFLYIGYIRHHKGIDILLKTFELIMKKNTNVKLFLAGIRDSDLKRYGLKAPNNVYLLGFIKDLEKYMEKCAFYVTTPKYEPGPTASIEAMCAGLIPIVNYMTGHKDHVKQVSKDLIINSLNPKDVANKILKIMKRNDLKKLSNKSRKIALKYTKEKMLTKFKKAFYDLIKET